MGNHFHRHPSKQHQRRASRLACSLAAVLCSVGSFILFGRQPVYLAVRPKRQLCSGGAANEMNWSKWLGGNCWAIATSLKLEWNSSPFAPLIYSKPGLKFRSVQQGCDDVDVHLGPISQLKWRWKINQSLAGIWGENRSSQNGKFCFLKNTVV